METQDQQGSNICDNTFLRMHGIMVNAGPVVEEAANTGQAYILHLTPHIPDISYLYVKHQKCLT